MFSKTSSPIGFLRAYGVTMTVILTLYIVLILVPSYWSGLYLASDEQIMKGHYNVPFYNAFPLLLSYEATKIILAFALIFLFVAIPLSVITISIVLLRRSTLSISQQIFWFASFSLMIVGLALSNTAALSLLDWVIGD